MLVGQIVLLSCWLFFWLSVKLAFVTRILSFTKDPPVLDVVSVLFKAKVVGVLSVDAVDIGAVAANVINGLVNP